MFDSIKVQVDQYEELINNFKELDLSKAKFLNANGTKNWNAISKAIGTTDELAISYFKTMDDGNGTINNTSASVAGMSTYLHKSGQAFNFAAIEATLFNTALNAGIFLVASLAIKGITTAIDNYVNRAEKAIELTEDLKSKHEDVNKEYESHKELVDELAESYERLSKGVDTTTNKNVNLSSEEYEEYLDITNQLSEAFPTLYKTLDENGNAILTLGQNGQSATDDLRDLLEAEKDLNNYKIAQDIDDLFGGVKVKIDEANDALRDYEDSTATLQKNYDLLKGIANDDYTLSSDEELFSVDTSKDGGIEYYNSLTQAIQNFYNTLDSDRQEELQYTFSPEYVVDDKGDGLFDFYLKTSLLTEDEIQDLTKELRIQTKDTLPVLQDAIESELNNKNLKKQEADLAWQDFLPSLSATAKSMGSFKALDGDLQDLGLDIISGLDSGVYEEMDGDVAGWIRTNIILPLSQIDPSDKKEVVNAYKELLQLDPNDLSDANQNTIDSLICSIAEILNTSEEQIRLNLEFVIDEDYAEKYKNATERFGSDSSTVLEQFFANKSINTEKEIDYFNEVTKSAKSAEAAIKMYTKAVDDANEKQPLSFTDSISQVQKLSEGLDQLDEVYADIYDKGDFDYSSILNNDDFAATFGNLTNVTDEYKDAYDDFLQTVSNSPKDINACQNAFDKLATAYIQNSGYLNNLTEESKAATVAMLKQMGIANAEEIVTEALKNEVNTLAAAQKSLNEAKEAGVTTNIDLENASLAEIYTLIQEYERLGLNTDSLYDYMQQKIAANNAVIATNGDINALSALCTQLGVASDACARFAKIKQELATLSTISTEDTVLPDGSIQPSIYSTADVEYYTSKLQKEANSLASDMQNAITNYTPTANYTGGSKTNKSKSGSGSTTTDDFKETLDWIETKISRIERKISNLDKTVQATYKKWSTRNKAITQELSAVKNEITVQEQAYDRYMQKANSVKLSSKYKKLVREGKIDIETITDEDLKEKIEEYQQWCDHATLYSNVYCKIYLIAGKP